MEEGCLDFACDETGRHGGLIEGGAPYFAEWDPEKIIQVKVVSASKSLKEVLSRHNSIDILKIDVEGYENKILSDLKTEDLSHVVQIFAETEDDQKINGFFSESACGLTRYYRIQS